MLLAHAAKQGDNNAMIISSLSVALMRSWPHSTGLCVDVRVLLRRRGRAGRAVCLCRVTCVELWTVVRALSSQGGV
jgi:hypothetical protein